MKRSCWERAFVEEVRKPAEKLKEKMLFNYNVDLLRHFQVLLRCRAIENQCYVIAAAQTGQHNPKRRSYGHAMVRNLGLLFNPVFLACDFEVSMWYPKCWS